MGKYCCVVGCTAEERKSAKLEKYLWMRIVTFWSFPPVARARTAHYIWICAVRRDESCRPNHQTRICSTHFVGGMGPTEYNPYPTLFPHNFGLSGTPSRPWPVRRVMRRLPLPQRWEAASVNTPKAVSILLVRIDVLDIGCEVTVGDETTMFAQVNITFEMPSVFNMATTRSRETTPPQHSGYRAEPCSPHVCRAQLVAPLTVSWWVASGHDIWGVFCWLVS